MAVGSVVGGGPRARAWIGRLRGAVRNLASTGLPPDELLSRLDHLATRWGHGPDARQGFFRGATCLYAIYDPVSRHCAVSRAGHRPPAVISPHGRVEFPDVPPGRPSAWAAAPSPQRSGRCPRAANWCSTATA
ncbi:hypothetical protein SO3561_08438 [Streptomyces olivochromogenes]|uniref:PPM-type phosphatase domain-containing protein n=1 Tax=Streptomyces olivochromogenes TaxID=1963 RepID=A0A250VSC3_STROL|nr:PP2C family protein-serine/threonine phosphatase [Streptomyces olivochromogenes]GAX56870.1 hypothetical protein SO3561_08438 [Streptomyces olivochromogenes]